MLPCIYLDTYSSSTIEWMYYRGHKLMSCHVNVKDHLNNKGRLMHECSSKVRIYATNYKATAWHELMN